MLRRSDGCISWYSVVHAAQDRGCWQTLPKSHSFKPKMPDWRRSFRWDRFVPITWPRPRAVFGLWHPKRLRIVLTTRICAFIASLGLVISLSRRASSTNIVHRAIQGSEFSQEEVGAEKERTLHSIVPIAAAYSPIGSFAQR
jgi:hypothetical protein